MKFRAKPLLAAWLLCGVPLIVASKSPGQDAGFVASSSTAGMVTITVGAHNRSGTVDKDFKVKSSALSLVKTGSGTVLMSGRNAFSGGITLDGGVLALGNPPIGAANQTAFGSGLITINNRAILRLGNSSKPAAGSYTLANYIQINRGVIDLVAGNPHFAGHVTIGPGGATLITHARGNDMYFDADVTGEGPLAVDNEGTGAGGVVRFTNGLSLMGTVRVDGTSAGLSGGRIFLGDRDALNQATLVAVAGMRGIDFAPAIKAFSLGGLTGDAGIDLKGKILRIGVSSTDLTYSGSFSDSAGGGGVIKSGSGTMTLTGNQYSRASISVHLGTLVVAGVVAGEIKVGDPKIPLARTVLTGTGSVGDILLQTPGAVVQPGAGGSSTGILAARNFSMIPGSNLSVRLGGKVPGAGQGSGGYDQIRASGQFSLYGNLEVSLVGGFQPKPGEVFYIMVTSGSAPVLGRFCNLVSNELTVAGHRFRINYAADSTKSDPASATGHDIALTALGGE